MNIISTTSINTLIIIIEKAGLTWLITSDNRGKPVLKIYEDPSMEREVLKFHISP